MQGTKLASNHPQYYLEQVRAKSTVSHIFKSVRQLL
jgi:hypothetical protein